MKGALLEVANDRYVFQTAESGSAVELESSGLDGRLKFLEDSIIQIQKSIAGLSSVPPGKPTAGGLSAGSGSSTPRPTSKAKAMNAAAKPGLARGALAGMDPTVVQAAMAAGVPEKHLVEMAQVLKQRPSTLDDAPKARKKSVWSPLEESEEEEEAEAADGAGAEAGSSSEVGKALTKLTQICSTLVDQKQKKGDLEHLLDGSGLASSSESQNVPSSRRNAAALRALQRALKENPRLVYQSIEANLLSDFHAQPTAPGEPFGTATVRGWLTSRSRLQNFTSHVRWSWQVAGVWDSLIRGSHEEARARCAVLIAAADQAAIDSGNWIMANVSLLEAPPPYQAFSSHTSPTPQELQHSSLLDPRWVEVFLGHIKEQDSYQESKRKLGKGGGKADRDTTERGGAGDPKPGPKKTPKKKAAAGDSQAAGEA